VFEIGSAAKVVAASRRYGAALGISLKQKNESGNSIPEKPGQSQWSARSPGFQTKKRDR
jgi:hypothetical protein